MQTQVKNIGDSTLELTVELARDELVRYIHRTETAFGEQLSVDGFRRGKVPKELLKKHLDQGQVLQTALQSALQDSLANVIREQDFDVMQTRDLTIQENTAERLKYSIVLVVFPKVRLPELTGFKAVRQEVAVREEDLQEAIDVIRNWRASFALKDGPAEQGDRVEVDFKVSLDGKLLEGGESKSHPLVIGGKGFMPGFEEQLVGLKKGESKSFTLTAPDDYYQKNLAGKRLDFDVTMSAVQQVRLPDLDDAFARSVGKFDSLEQFKTNLREGIQREKEEKERQRVRLEILDQLISRAEIEPPALLVKE
ncbi:MAG: trigger factor, partial [Acidobacteria bacterium]|nr:trigger factor [Acidobacteriota bacterium]